MLLTPRWLGWIAVTIAASAVMVMLGRWQWSRYELRHEINKLISSTATPVDFRPSLPEWTPVTVIGQYDPGLEVLVRNRTVNGRLGYEVLTPMILADGTAVLIDRGWVPPHETGITATPDVPAPPPGTVTVTGRVRATESDPRLELRNGHWEARRIGVAQIAVKVPYKIAPTYVMAADSATELTPVPAGRENDWLNLGYAVQWWIFAGGAFFALFWLARRERRASLGLTRPSGDRDVAQQESLR